METKLCRICGRLGTTHQDIFKIEGLKHKLETCLPIFVTQHCLLPDTICQECVENVSNFYNFIKNCLQSIIVLESQYDVTESCLRSKRRQEKSCMVNFLVPMKTQNTQTEDQYDFMFTKFNEENSEKTKLPFQGCDINLVDYEIDSEAEPESCTQNNGVVIVRNRKIHKTVDDFLENLLETKTVFTKQYFDNLENDLISEIVQKKEVKRKSNTIENLPLKICKFETGNRRKCKVPQKIEFNICSVKNEIESVGENNTQIIQENFKEDGLELNAGAVDIVLPQLCLLCNEQFQGPAALSAHIFEAHDLECNQTIENCDKKKRIPNLVKISDMKRNNSYDDNQHNDPMSPQNATSSQGEQNLISLENACQMCSYSTSTKQELHAHCRSNHPVEVPLMCGICLQPTTTLLNLKNHLKICAIEYPVTTRYFCSVCKYGEDGMKEMESHVLVHEFLLDMCKKEIKMFDPADYVELNPSCEFGPLSPTSKNLTCTLCFQSNFQSFNDFSDHRRKQHSKFHCDLCNKFYGRNSHLWKHVNRLHKNHPSITCQICYKTSASKYHLSQHFSKIHSAKQKNGGNSFENTLNAKNSNTQSRSEQYIFRKFNPFDFQNTENASLRTDFLKLEKKSSSSDFDDLSNNATSDQEISDDVFMNNENITVPKEVDASSNLYTNIITNYTPPPNCGEFKCPKCCKGFAKRLLLKKHKKNCRPKSQKDLLTRCKSCARIFKDRQSLAKHLVNYHSEYTCEICSQKSQSKCEIVSHIRFTHPNCVLHCKICGSILRSKQNLTDHLNDHSNSYVCQFCGDALSSKIKLKMHILSLHRKILSLSCGICLRLFENQHILRNHVQLTHKNDLRPFTSCTVCGKNYGSKWKTYDHLNKSHGRIFKACKVCLEIFNSEEELNSHCDEIHYEKNRNITNVKSTQSNSYPEEMDAESVKEELEDVSEVDKSTEGVFNNFVSEMSGFSRMSLLEKRLIGKSTTNDEIHVKTEKDLVGEKFQPNVEKQKILSMKKVHDSFKFEEDMIGSQQSTSKRTVYVNSDEPSLCEICFKTWPAKKHLWQHYIRCHKSVAATVCGICLKTNNDYLSLQHHLRTNHPTLLHGQGFGSNFICRICGRYHNASSKLRLHMAIHENFDWDILQVKTEEKSMLNGVESKNTGFVKTEHYFESLIEQVECSSNEEGESDDDEKNKCGNNANENSSSSGMIEEESAIDSISENSAEAQNEEMNNTEICRSDQIRTLNDNTDSESSEIDGNLNTIFQKHPGNASDFQSTESDDSSSESCSSENEEVPNEDRLNTGSSNEPLIMNGLTNSNSNGLLVNMMGDSIPFNDNGLFRFKTEELDSAVKSISFECGEEIRDNSEIEYCELPMSSALNEREIESAVGSIL